MNSSKKTQIAKIALILLSVAVLVLAIVTTTFAVKNHNLTKADAERNAKLESAISQNDAFKAQESKKQEDFDSAISEKDASHAKEKAELEKKIADLQKQLAIKRAAAQANQAKPNAPKPTGKKVIYLTFDDGPSARTPEVLKILRDNGIKATFFVVNGHKNNHYMKDIVAEGHVIALHSYTHDYKKIYASDDAFYQDLKQISDLVYEQTGIRSKMMRFPGGGSNTISRKSSPGIMSRLTKKVGEMGYTYFDWNLSSGDASYPSPSVAQLIENCKRLPKSDSVIVLMHDAGDKKNTVAALPEIISYYKSLGYSFASLSPDVPPAHQKVAN